MKKILLFSLLVVGTQVSHADDYSTFTLARQSGTTTSLTSVGTKIVFSDGNLVATSGNTTVTIDLTDMASMYFSSASTGISRTTADGLGISTSGRNVVVTSGENGTASVVNLSGQLVGSATVSAGSAATIASNLAPGVYIVKVNQQTIKAVVK